MQNDSSDDEDEIIFLLPRLYQSYHRQGDIFEIKATPLHSGMIEVTLYRVP